MVVVVPKINDPKYVVYKCVIILSSKDSVDESEYFGIS